MKKTFVAALFVVVLAAAASAHPPTDLVLDYDPDQKALSVTMRHVTIERLEHYVRLITVTVNGGEPKVFRYTRQDQPSFVEVILPVEAGPDDTIHVKASCLKGGTIEGEIRVPQKEEVKSEETGKVIEATGEEEPEDFDPSYKKP